MYNNCNWLLLKVKQCALYTGKVLQEVKLPDNRGKDDILSLCLTSNSRVLTVSARSRGLIQFDIH